MKSFSHPAQIVADLNIFGGQQVADFGAGHGAYTFPLSEKVAANDGGHVFAIDVHKNLLHGIESMAKEKNHKNIRIIWSDVEDKHGSQLRDESIDFVVMANLLFQLDDKKAALREALRILKPEGQLLIIDWSDSFGHIGPHAGHVVVQSTAELLCEEVGFIKNKDIRAGEHHYGFLVKKN